MAKQFLKLLKIGKKPDNNVHTHVTRSELKFSKQGKEKKGPQ